LQVGPVAKRGAADEHDRFFWREPDAIAFFEGLDLIPKRPILGVSKQAAEDKKQDGDSFHSLAGGILFKRIVPDGRRNFIFISDGILL
jgi:hypothetical protein